MWEMSKRRRERENDVKERDKWCKKKREIKREKKRKICEKEES